MQFYSSIMIFSQKKVKYIVIHSFIRYNQYF